MADAPDPEQRLAKFKKALGDKDPYAVIGVEETASDVVIKKAYRKKALKLHPDRNRDKEDATEIFQVLVQANELLADNAVKALYDAELRKRNAAKLRDLKMNAEQRAAKHDLEAREQAFKKRRMESQNATRSMAQEIVRVREDGERRLKEQQQRAAAAKKVAAGSRSGGGASAGNGEGAATDGGAPTLKIKWHTKGIAAENGGYTTAELTRLFSKYGGNPTVMLKKKNGAALVAFDTAEAARNAAKFERGTPANPFKDLSWVGAEPPAEDGDHGANGDAGSSYSRGGGGGSGGGRREGSRGGGGAPTPHDFGFYGGGAGAEEGEGGFGAGGGAGGRGFFDTREGEVLRRMLAAGSGSGSGEARA